MGLVETIIAALIIAAVIYMAKMALTLYRHKRSFLQDFQRIKTNSGPDLDWGFWRRVQWIINTSLMFQEKMLEPADVAKYLESKEFRKALGEMINHFEEQNQKEG